MIGKDTSEKGFQGKVKLDPFANGREKSAPRVCRTDEARYVSWPEGVKIDFVLFPM